MYDVDTIAPWMHPLERRRQREAQLELRVEAPAPPHAAMRPAAEPAPRGVLVIDLLDPDLDSRRAGSTATWSSVPGSAALESTY